MSDNMVSFKPITLGKGGQTQSAHTEVRNGSHTFHLSARDAQAGGSLGAGGQPGLHSVFQASQYHKESPCLKKKQKNPPNKNRVHTATKSHTIHVEWVPLHGTLAHTKLT